ncbi:MAG: hypothetical protein R3D29_06625 [Nitratireductor sp.]
MVDLELDNIPVRELNAIVTGGLLTGDFLFELINGSEVVDYLFGNGGMTPSTATTVQTGSTVAITTTPSMAVQALT